MSSKARLAGILLVSAAALAANGYHLGVDDSAIYVPGIKMAADPSLFPAGSAFFVPHATFTLFPQLIALSARLLRAPIDWAIFAWYVISLIFLFSAGWALLGACFQGQRARWAGLCTLAVALATPVAGTALILVDPYLTSRSLSTPATLFAIAAFAQNRTRAALLWMLAAIALHPQMGLYGIAALGLMAFAARQTQPLSAEAAVAAAFAPFTFSFDLNPAEGVYREILQTRPYFFVWNWHWYEMMGAIAPLILLWLFSRIRSARVTPSFTICSRALVLFGGVFSIAGIVLSSSPNLESMARLQPMRCFHLIYVVMFLFLGGLLGEFVLRQSIWRWAACFAPIFAMTWALQASEFPSSPHIEIPGMSYRYGWVPALLWIRDNTPKQAVFAMDPDYFTSAGVDLHGFRAIAERGALADNRKDSGAVSLFPQLGNQWKHEVMVQEAWRASDYRNYGTLMSEYGIQWFIVARQYSAPGWTCPYQNHDFRVCTVARSAP